MSFHLSVLLLLQLVLHSYTVALPCHSLLVKDNEECACPNGANDHNQRRDVYGGLVHCSFQCKNGTGCYAAAEILYPACVTFDHNSSRMIAGYCPAAHWKVYSILSLPDYINNSSCPVPKYRAGTLRKLYSKLFFCWKFNRNGLPFEFQMPQLILVGVLVLVFATDTDVSSYCNLPATACLT